MRFAQIPHEMVTQSRNSYVEADLHAPTLGELCKQLEDDDGTYPTHMEGRHQNLLKEAREKSKYWVSCSSSDNAELYYKKVGFLFFFFYKVFWVKPKCRTFIKFLVPLPR